MLIRRDRASSRTCRGMVIDVWLCSKPLTKTFVAISFFLPCMLTVSCMHKSSNQNRRYIGQDLHSVNSCRLHSLSWTIQKSGYRFHEVKSFNHSKNKYYFVLSEGRGETFSGETPLPLFRINSVFFNLFLLVYQSLVFSRSILSYICIYALFLRL